LLFLGLISENFAERLCYSATRCTMPPNPICAADCESSFRGPERASMEEDS
jgi:hypothetical protein